MKARGRCLTLGLRSGRAGRRAAIDRGGKWRRRRRRLGETLEREAQASSSAAGPTPFLPTFALSIVLAFAGFLALLGLVLLIDHPTPLGIVLGVRFQENQDAETLLFVAAFVVIFPLASWIGPRLADRIAFGPNAGGLNVLTSLLAIALLLAIIAVKLSSRLPWGDGVGCVFAASLIWFAGAGAALSRATQPRVWEGLLRRSPGAARLWALAAGLVLGALPASPTSNR